MEMRMTTIEKSSLSSLSMELDSLPSIFSEVLTLQESAVNMVIVSKYGHICQAKGGTRTSPGTHPTLETNK